MRLFLDRVLPFGWLQAEADRLANEIEKMREKESRELEQERKERSKKMVMLIVYMLELHCLDPGVWF